MLVFLFAVSGSVRSYKWEKNGVDLDQGSLPNTEGRIDGTITIERATSLDEGYYQCFATNQYGTALSIVSYAARGVLRLLTTPDVTTVTVREGEPFHILYATVKSSPKPIYGWEVAIGTSDRSSTPVTLSNRVQLADNGKTANGWLILQSASPAVDEASIWVRLSVTHKSTAVEGAFI